MAATRQRRVGGAAVLQASKTQAIVEAAFQELADAGYRRLTMDAVAARAGVGKAALYRRWRSKDAMLVDLVADLGTQTVLPPDEGSLRKDLVAFVSEAIEALSHSVVAQVALELASEARHKPALAKALETRFRAPRLAAGHAMHERAISRGELLASADTELALDLIAGPLLMRSLLTDEPLPADYPERLVDAVLRALGATT